MADEPESGAGGGGPLARTPDMANLSATERARLYKERAAAAGIGRAPSIGDAPADVALPAPAGAPASVVAAANPTPTAAVEKPAPAAAAEKPAAPKPAAAKPAPKEEVPEADPAELPALKAIAPELTWARVHGYVEVMIGRDKLTAMAREIRDNLGYDYLSAITAVDW